MPSEKVLSAKQAQVEELVEKLQKASAGVLVDYRGLTVEEDTELRVKLRTAGVDYKVVKNTLTRFAANQVGLEALDEALNGPTSLALGFDDPIPAAKILVDFAKDNDKLEIKAGFLDGKVISLDEIKKLAETPSKDVLIAKIMGSLNSSVSKLVRTLQALVDNGVEPADITTEAKEEVKAEEVAAEEVKAEAAVEEVKQAEAEAPAAE